MKIAIASDHAGFELKEKIRKDYPSDGLIIDDFGTFSCDSVDYPDMAEKIVEPVRSKEYDLGILVCGTGIGISIAANRHSGIRAAILYDDFVAHAAKEHNDANVVVFGSRTMSYDDVKKRLDIFLAAKFEGGRHQRRIEKLK